MAYEIHARTPNGLMASDEALDDSDKSFDWTALLGQSSAPGFLEILGLRIEFNASASAGTRLLQLRIIDAAVDVLFDMDIAAGSIIADAGATIQMIPNMTVADFTRNSIDFEWMPRLYLAPRTSLQILDRATIDVAADDMILHVTAGLVASVP